MQFVLNQPPTNGLGLAGFITSLVGLVSCGLLSPIGLILSIVGLFKAPRGFAIAGTVIGALGSLFMALMGLTLVLGFLGLGKAVQAIGQQMQTQQTAHQAYLAIDASRTTSRAVPNKQAGTAIAAGYSDAWKTPLRYEPSDSTFELISAGPDKQFGTGDDIRITEAELKAPPTSFPTTLPDTDR
jgi:type II secretory pathway pseudopilin PulG